MAEKKETMTIDQALIAIQGKLKAPKSKFNKFGNYKYRSCEDILESVKPLLAEYGVLMTISDKVMPQGDRYYIEATVTVTKNGQSVSATASAREEETKKGMDGSQITGTSSSYARKYALNGLFLIDDTKDADTDEYHNQTNQEAKQPQPQPQQSKPQPATSLFNDVDEETELKAEADALAAESSVELTALWNKYKHINPAYTKVGSIFYKAVQKRGQQLKAEGK